VLNGTKVAEVALKFRVSEQQNITSRITYPFHTITMILPHLSPAQLSKKSHIDTKSTPSQTAKNETERYLAENRKKNREMQIRKRPDRSSLAPDKNEFTKTNTKDENGTANPSPTLQV
jgi:hypothetical protein